MERLLFRKMLIMPVFFFLCTFMTIPAYANETDHYADYLAANPAPDYTGQPISLTGERARVQVEQSGYYTVQITYRLEMGNPGPTERNILIDGVIPYREAMNFLLDKQIVYDQYPFPRDEYGHQRLPKQTERTEATAVMITDRESQISGYLRFYLSAGEHELAVEGGKGRADILGITLCPPYDPPSYEEYRAGQPSDPGISGQLLIVEAEALAVKSGKNILPTSISDAGVTPSENGKQTLNALGVGSFEDAGDYGEWVLDIKQAGYYHLAFKYKQDANAGLNTYRTVSIDGQVPFEEWSAVAFPFTTRWQNLTMNDTPVYLTEGQHSLRLTVTRAPYKEISEALNRSVTAIRELDLEIKSIIGTDTDVYRIWKLESYIPDLAQQLAAQAEVIESLTAQLTAITGNREYRALQSASADLRAFSQKPDDLAKSADSLKWVYEPLIDWLLALEKQPVILDKFYLYTEDTPIPNPNASFFTQLAYMVKNFFVSFTDSAGMAKKTDTEGIQVWVRRNRDYVDLMQQMSNEYFTEETGIPVTVNYIPDNNVLVLANAAGKLPELAAGIDMATPFEYAMRGALEDLGAFPGYKELISPMAQGALVPYHFKGGDYGLPEEVLFNVLYYRSDILNRIGLSVPQTWDDVLDAIPILIQNNYTFFYPYGDYQTFYTQRGVPVYTADGLSLACDTDEGFDAFKFWTDLYVKYGLPPKMESFYQHFRLGDTPLGVAGINEYIRFDRTAPDIAGYWDVALIPGTLQADGTVNRSQAGNQTGIMMFDTEPKREERAWQFLQWWLDTETQALYAENLENFYGPEFRWYTANYQVLDQINWNDNAKAVFDQQLRWYNPVPYVPGGSYMTGREIWNAWNRVVIDKLNFREQLEIAYRDIRMEMERKQKEFGLIDTQGKTLDTLDFLPVTLPVETLTAGEKEGD